MENIKNKVVIITGASEGNGKATVKKLAHEGAKVVMFSRTEEKLSTLKNELSDYVVDYKVGDVRNLSDVKDLVQYTLDKYDRIDVFYHNAGVLPMGALANSDAEKVSKWQQAFDTNVMGVVNGLAACLPVMEKQKFGHMIATDSVMGRLVIPNAAIYCSTKFAVRAIMEGVRQEHLEDNIKSTIISPGLVSTGLLSSVDDKGMEAWIEGELKDDTKALSPESVADAVAYAISTPKNVVISEILMRSSKHVL